MKRNNYPNHNPHRQHYDQSEHRDQPRGQGGNPHHRQGRFPQQQHRDSSSRYHLGDQNHHAHQGAPELPPGWVEATDPSSGNIYYANPTTKETRWDRPQAAVPSIQCSNTNVPIHGNDQVRVPGIRTNQTTGRSTGDGNVLYTAGGSASSNEAILQPHKIVKVAREMLEKVQAFPEQTVASDLELHSLTPGQIADLCNLQRRIHQQLHQEELYHKQQQHRPDQHAINEPEEEEYVPLPPYTPINPFTMPQSGSMLMNRTEPARLDVRMNSLRRELKAYGYKGNPK
jgi:WW domain